jgi:hypothetical protein
VELRNMRREDGSIPVLAAAQLSIGM